MEEICLGEYFKTGLCLIFLSMKEDVWTGKILQPCQYFLKQAECEYFVLVSTRDSFLSVNVNPLFLS